MMKRKFINIHDALREAREDNPLLTTSDGLAACYSIDNMGWTKDGTSRWYHFNDVNGNPVYTIKH